MKFDIPISPNDLSLNALGRNIQFYGCINNNFPTGRPKDTEDFTKNNYIKKLHEYKNQGSEINYLLNGNVKDFNIDTFEKYFTWIIESVSPDLITFSDSNIYHYLKLKFAFNNFEISAIAGIKNLSSFNRFLKNGKIDISDINKIVLHHDFVIDGLNSIDFIKTLNDQSIEPRVLVTESCYYNCPYRRRHYDSIVDVYKKPYSSHIDYFQVDCILKRLSHPESLLDLSGFLLPEQLKLYSERTGINAFKISGRSKSSEWIYNTAHAYINQKSPENLYDIIVFTSPFLSEFNMDIQDLFYLDSLSYFEFSDELMQITDKSIRQLFISQKAKELFKNGLLRINDPGSNYGIKNDRIVIKEKGKYMQYLERINSGSKHVNQLIGCNCNV